MKKTCLCGVLACLAGVSCVAADSVYQLTGNVTDGLDLLSMTGYRADALAGPSAQGVTVSGPITHADVTPENPFTLVGYGKTTTFAADTGISALPLYIANAPGVTGMTTWKFTGFYEISAAKGNVITLGPGAHVYIENNANMNIYGRETGASFAFTVPGGSWQGSRLNFHSNITVTASNASFNYWGGIQVGCEMPREDVQTYTFSNTTLTAAHERFIIGAKSLRSTNGLDHVVVNLENGTVMNVQNVHVGGGPQSRIRWRGGRLSVSCSTRESLFQMSPWVNNAINDVVLTLERDGAPVDVEHTHDKWLCAGYENRQINLTGNGGFVKRGAGTLVFSPVPASDAAKRSTCDYTGDTVVKGGGIILTNSWFTPGRGGLVLESAGTFLDLNGIPASFTGASGSGYVTNRLDETAVLTLGYADADAAFDVPVYGAVDVVKTGTGTLTFGPNAAAFGGDLTVSGGTVCLTGRSVTNVAQVVVGQDATLDLRGATFVCRALARRGRVLTDERTVLRIVAESGTEANKCVVPLSGTFLKEGAGALTVYGTGATTCDVTVRDGTLHVKPLLYGGKYFRVNVSQTDLSIPSTGSKWHKRIGEFSLYDANGIRINAGAYTYEEKPGEGQYNGYGGLSNASTLEPWEVALHTTGYYAYDAGCGPQMAFDGDPATHFDNKSWWGSESFMFRLPDDAADAAGYTFTTPTNQRNDRPVQWTIYGSTNGIDWVTLDDNLIDWTDETARTAAIAATPAVGATEYNGGVPYTFDKMPAGAALAPFGTEGIVEVAAGAVLAFASPALQLGALRIDCAAGAGTVSNFTPLANGTVWVTNLPEEMPTGGYPLPITVTGVSDGAAFLTWEVRENGEVSPRFVLQYRSGALYLVGKGMTLIVR